MKPTMEIFNLNLVSTWDLAGAARYWTLNVRARALFGQMWNLDISRAIVIPTFIFHFSNIPSKHIIKQLNSAWDHDGAAKSGLPKFH